MATEISTTLTFPDIDFLVFTRVANSIETTEEFNTRARTYADEFKQQMSAALASGGDKLFIEYMGDRDAPYFVGLPSDEPFSLTREQVVSLRDGLTRILETEVTHGPSVLDGRDGLPSYWAMAAGFLLTEVGLPPSEEIREAHDEMQARVPEILVALAAGVATPEQLANVVELPSGVCKTWAHVTDEELAELRRVHAF